MAEIQLKHVYKKYEDKVVAVQDFNLKIKDQEFVIFVGPSGCGKSTTLRMIAGLEEISDGELLIDGKMMTGGEQNIYFAELDGLQIRHYFIEVMGE